MRNRQRILASSHLKIFKMSFSTSTKDTKILDSDSKPDHLDHKEHDCGCGGEHNNDSNSLLGGNKKKPIREENADEVFQNIQFKYAQFQNAYKSQDYSTAESTLLIILEKTPFLISRKKLRDYDMALFLFCLSETRFYSGNLVECRKSLDTAISVAESSDILGFKIQFYFDCASLEEKLGNIERAKKLYNFILSARDQQDNLDMFVKIQVKLAGFELLDNKFDVAENLLKNVVDLTVSLGMKEETFECKYGLSECELFKGNKMKTKMFLSEALKIAKSLKRVDWISKCNEKMSQIV
jgi:tetratricopeptide (TPR) repeat protein